MSKKPIKKIIAPVKRQKAFDLSKNSAQQSSEMIEALSSLQMDIGWLLLVDMLKGNIAQLETSIIRKVDESGKPISDTECDALRYKLEYIEELINKPTEIIKQLQKKAPPIPTYDPYDISKATEKRMGGEEL